MTAIEREDPQPRTLGQESPDYLLVEQARAGDQEAFGELVRRHRAKALGWAGRLTGDSHLAEDIVQEALLRAFLHMGTLANTDRFTPWLQRIVRNQAYMKLRRGGPFGKEQPYASLGPREKQATAAGNGLEPTDWGISIRLWPGWTTMPLKKLRGGIIRRTASSAKKRWRASVG